MVTSPRLSSPMMVMEAERPRYEMPQRQSFLQMTGNLLIGLLVGAIQDIFHFFLELNETICHETSELVGNMLLSLQNMQTAWQERG